MFRLRLCACRNRNRDHHPQPTEYERSSNPSRHANPASYMQ
jgi:hypothetical protein